MLAKGDVIAGRFRLIRPIGNGGMASVWLARHELIERDVALKLTPTDRRAPDATARFLREARIVGKFQHRNIVSVVDAGELPEQGYLFLAMELLRGAPLSDRFVPDEPIPATEIVPILVEVCQGLEVAHAAGVVHRDIKPENVVLAETTGGVVPKIVDFGISQSESDGRPAITLDGSVLGTPNYMSPEQAMGTKSVDLRSDIWAVGVILYEALSGRQPFAAATQLATMRRIVDDEPEPLAASVDERLRAIVDRCLAKDPARRFPDASSLRAALESFARSPERCAAVTSTPARSDEDTGHVARVSARWQAIARKPRATGRVAFVAALCGAVALYVAAFRPGDDEAQAAPATPPSGALVAEGAAAGELDLAAPWAGLQAPGSGLQSDPQLPPPAARSPKPQAVRHPAPTPPLTRVTSPGF